MKSLLISLVVGFAIAPPCLAEYRLAPMDKVWSGHAVNFALVVGERHVYAGYYDSERRLTIASRPRDSSAWTYTRLDVVTGWDSHNYVAMALDARGYLHVMANMHNDPLVYFRAKRPHDASSLQRVASMVDASRERRMTYPVFLPYLDGRLVLKYRDGGSGNGNEIYNVYDPSTSTWSALLTTPLVDGEGKRNAYFVGPRAGPDGWFHLAWVWRDTPDAETNHDLSYARSRDLVHWEKSDGTTLELPIRLSTAEIVDPVPVLGGMINNNTVVGFDAQGRPVITYHKFDALGNTQIFLARRERRNWRIVQLTDWREFRWDFRGRGSLDSRVTVTGAVPSGPRHIAVQVTRDGHPLFLRARSRDLRLVSEESANPVSVQLAHQLDVPAGMQLNTVIDESTRQALAWATLPPNRDQPRDHVPAPTTLYLAVPVEVLE